MRSFLIAALIGSTVLTAQTPPPASARQPEWFERLTAWIEAVDAHIVGTRDAPLRVVQAWSNEQFDAALPNINGFVEMLTHPGDRRVRSAGRRFTRDDLRLLSQLVDAWLPRLESRRLIERAALFHTDLAMSPSRAEPAPMPQRSPVPPIRPVTPSRPTILMIEDGQLDRIEQAGMHWSLARSLMNILSEDVANDARVRLWYQATATFMSNRRHHAYSMPQLESARKLFPTDPEIQFFSGVLCEALTSSEIQNAVRTMRAERGIDAPVPPVATSLDEAATYFRAALKARGDFAEAQVRLGNVLGRRGNHRAAIDELERVRRSTEAPTLLYYANLFLGREADAMSQLDLAREAYDRAAALFPRAQSPRLALSQIARRTGDRTNARGSLGHILEAPEPDDRRDPWWSYYQNAGIDNVEALFNALRKPFLGQP